MTPYEILQSYFGYDSFRENQAEIIRQLLAGKDAFVLMPTGIGKSICYQIPSMIRPGVGIVISPLIALMQDQVEALRQFGIRADFLNSSLSKEQARNVEQRLLAREIDLLYVAPERLMTQRFLDMLKQASPALFAIDEAHCVSQWGHDFRPEYLQLSILSEMFPDIPRMALTATADKVTRKEIVEKLKLANAGQFISSFDRPNICYRVEIKNNPKKQLHRFLESEHQGDSGIVYCLSRKKVDATAEWLCKKGYAALPYHAGMDNSLRAEHQKKFLRGEGLIIVATIAFGLGIDKPDVRFVAHLDMPKSMESYYQETGRAGRDGLPANAWMVYGLSDVIALRYMIESSEGDEQFKWVQRRRLEAMLGYCETIDCRRKVLLKYLEEDLPEPCGNCDTCIEPVETWDGTIVAQKALSCVYRTDQRFGAQYLTDILRGNSNQRIKRFKHDTIKTFGVGQDLSEMEWKSVFRQLITSGLLEADMGGRNGFRLRSESWPVLKGEQKVKLRRDLKVDTPSGYRAKRRKNKIEFENSESLGLWDHLRELRLKISKEAEIPPFVVFHDKTLKEMVEYLPSSKDEMLEVSGVGQHKLDLYGDSFLEAIKEFVSRTQSVDR